MYLMITAFHISKNDICAVDFNYFASLKWLNIDAIILLDVCTIDVTYHRFNRHKVL